MNAPTLRWPWDREQKEGVRPWTRDRIRVHLDRQLAKRRLVTAESAGDLVSILADAHYQGYVAREAIRLNRFRPLVGRRDAYLVVNQANQTIMSAMGRLGIYGASRDPRKPADAPLEDDLDFSPPALNGNRLQ